MVLKNLLIDLKNKRSMSSKIICYYLFYDGTDHSLCESPIIYEIDKKMINITHIHPKYLTVSNYSYSLG